MAAAGPPSPVPTLARAHGHSNGRSERRTNVAYRAYVNEMTRTHSDTLASAAQQEAVEKFNKNNPLGGLRKKTNRKRKHLKRKHLKRKTHRKH